MLKINHSSNWRSLLSAAVVATTAIAFSTSSSWAQDAAAPAPAAPAPAAAAAPAPAPEPAAAAPAAEAAPAAPTTEALEKRIADVEQYFNNMAPAADGKLANLSGPGHNGFLMICAALVLFMTLPGLALF
jgi:ammonium transporter, Amt family